MKESEKKAGTVADGDEAALRANGVKNQTPLPSGSVVSEEQIRMRAYELYRERGGKVGDDMRDWLLAEREYREHVSSRSSNPAGQQTSSPSPEAAHR